MCAGSDGSGEGDTARWARWERGRGQNQSHQSPLAAERIPPERGHHAGFSHNFYPYSVQSTLYSVSSVLSVISTRRDRYYWEPWEPGRSLGALGASKAWGVSWGRLE